MSKFMDDLIIPGAIGLVVLYTGIALIVYAILLIFYLMFEAAINDNYIVLCEFAVGIASAILAYVLIGLWLRRNGTI